MEKKIPIGISDFKELASGNYYFVDKTLFIKEMIEDGSQVILLPRPRRFGKTINMSMLRYFFENVRENNRHLFNGLNIEQYKNIMDNQGKYPVIFITFKDEKYSSWDSLQSGLSIMLSNVYKQYESLLHSDKLLEVEKKEFNKVLNREADLVELSRSLFNLSSYIYKQYNQKVVILIDEYDVPIQEAYIKDYYDEVIEFMRNFLSGGLKDNQYLEKAVLTGILRIAKESIFSGLNNIDAASLLSNRYSDKFGFTEKEVESLIKDYGINLDMELIKAWYNGYQFGDTIIYNPWSILNYIDKLDNGFSPYWVNTSSNDLIKRILGKASKDVKSDLEYLIKGGSITKIINENIVINEIDRTSDNLWSFLLFSGYLKFTNKEMVEGRIRCDLSIPNKEVKYVYEEIIINWFNESMGSDEFGEMLKALKRGEVEVFAEIFSGCVQSAFSYMNLGNESEKFYHAFVLGMLVALRNEYEVKSNRESGYGRYDVMLIPKNKQDSGIIIEFKKVSTFSGETLKTAADKALKQIKEKQYNAELLDKGISNILELAIVFEGKKVLVKKM